MDEAMSLELSTTVRMDVEETYPDNLQGLRAITTRRLPEDHQLNG